MTAAFDILKFEREHADDLHKIASQFRGAGVTPRCVLATVFLAAAGRGFRSAVRPVRRPDAWLITSARRMLRREHMPTAWYSLEEEDANGMTLGESIAEQEPEKNFWQVADAAGKENICDVLEGGTAALAERLGVTRRRAQQIFSEAAAGSRQGGLFDAGASA